MKIAKGPVVDETQWLADYFARYQKLLFQADVYAQLIQLKNLLTATHVAGKKVIMAGNGGSASIASHCAVDFTKNAGIRCVILRMGLTETFWGSSGIAPFCGEQGSDKKCHFVWPKSSESPVDFVTW